MSDLDMLQLAWLIEVIETRSLYGGTYITNLETIAYEGVSPEVAEW